MRVKINRNRKQLEFGKTYDITFHSCSYWWQIKFTRKNNIVVEEIVPREIIDNLLHVDVRRIFKISKRELKRILNDKEFIESVYEVEES